MAYAIHRRFNGSAIPDVLFPKLVPPFSKDLDTFVNFLKDIFKNDNCSRLPSAFDISISHLKERSFPSSITLTQQGEGQDATLYKHEGIEPPGGFYQPRSRHLDRSAVRSREDATALLPPHQAGFTDPRIDVDKNTYGGKDQSIASSSNHDE